MRSPWLKQSVLRLLFLSLSLSTCIFGQRCIDIKQRQEWRTLSRESQISYINAVKCLMTRRSKLNPFSGSSHQDDFQYVHSTLQGSVHFVAQFLVWHRHFIHLYEEALGECGHDGALPRWDWTLDAANVTAAPVWSSDPQVGFGTNGTGREDPSNGLDGGAVIDGAFANLELSLPFRHFLQRNWKPFSDISIGGSKFASQYYDQRAIGTIMRLTSYWEFAVALEGQDPSTFANPKTGPHGTIHALVGGDFPSSATSANDPLFFLHHANLDWLWWRWQQAEFGRRYAYEGNRGRGSLLRDARLTDTMEFMGLGFRNPRILSVMQTTTFPHCYTYV